MLFKQKFTQVVTYKVTYTISDFVNGQVRFQLGGGGSTVNGQVRGAGFGGNGTYTEYIVATDNHTSARFRGLSSLGGFTASIDNVSVKEVISATNTPRIDYSTGEEAFLLEPQSTNLITYSEDFSNSSWALSGTNPPVLTPSQFISPDGTQNASRLQIPITNTTSILQQLFSHTSGEEYTVSAYVKSNSSSNQEFKLYGDYGVPTGISGVLIATSEWQRFTFTYTATGTGSRSGGFYYVPNTNTDIQIYGFQAEQKSYATSYIPTDGASATRNQETCVDATPTINSEEGVLYAEIAALADDGTNRRIELTDGTSNNRIGIGLTTVANQIKYFLIADGVSQVNLNVTISNTLQYNKIAFKYKANDFELYVNGSSVSTDTSGSVSAANALNVLDFSSLSSTNVLYGNTKDLQVFDKALSDYQLKQLTTI